MKQCSRKPIKLKLKHLDLFLTEEPSYKDILIKVFQYKTKGFLRAFRLRGYVKEALELINTVSSVVPTELEVPDNLAYKLPRIDDLSTKARLGLEIMIESAQETMEFIDWVVDVVSITLFTANKNQPYDDKSPLLLDFKKEILNQPYDHIIGVVNWIKSEMIKSNTRWNDLFKEVSKPDPDYFLAGGHLLDRFNVINSIKKICKDFNLSYHEAWDIPYSVMQTNNLEGSTSAMVQERMAELKEARFKASQGGK